MQSSMGTKWSIQIDSAIAWQHECCNLSIGAKLKKLDIFCQEAAIDKKYQDQHPITVLEDSDDEEGERSITLAAILP